MCSGVDWKAKAESEVASCGRAKADAHHITLGRDHRDQGYILPEE